MRDYTFYIAVNPSLTEFYGHKGVPVKIGYVSQKNWGYRVRGLNGMVDVNSTKYGEVKDGVHILEENWRIPEGCFLYVRTSESPRIIEAQIAKEIENSGGQKIEGHFTHKNDEPVSSQELFILAERTKYFNVRRKRASWDTNTTFFGGRSPQQDREFDVVETKFCVEDQLRLIIRSLSGEFNQEQVVDGEA